MNDIKVIRFKTCDANMKKKFKAEVWLYPSETAAWHFITLNKELSKEIRDKYGKRSKGFGSLPVEVKIGKTEWKTSIFPNRKEETYLLPLKVSVREKEGIQLGDKVEVNLKI